VISATEVQRVGRTAQPHAVRDGLVLDIDWIVRHTTMRDWDGAMFELGATAAMELANQFNLQHGLIINGTKPRARIAKAKTAAPTT
jgi:hypothetical protein